MDSTPARWRVCFAAFFSYILEGPSDPADVRRIAEQLQENPHVALTHGFDLKCHWNHIHKIARDDGPGPRD